MKLKKILYDLIHKEIRRKIFFPNSKTSSVKIFKNINSFRKNDFFDIINKTLKPFLINKGFNGENDIYIKESENFYNRIVIAGSKYGKAFCINCEIKKKTLNKIELSDLDSFPTNFDFWIRLSPDKSDNWWFTDDSIEKNIKIIEEMIKLIEFEGFPFFERNNKKLK